MLCGRLHQLYTYQSYLNTYKWSVIVSQTTLTFQTGTSVRTQHTIAFIQRYITKSISGVNMDI